MNTLKHTTSQALILFLFFLFPHQVLALTAEEQAAANQDIQAKQRIESERREFIRQKESEEIDNIQKTRYGKVKSSLKDEVFDDKICKMIKEIRFSGNNEFSAWRLRGKFIKPLFKSKLEEALKVGKSKQRDLDYTSLDICITKLDLANLRKNVERFYLKKGYVLARVYFDTSKLSDGIITIVIEEGKLEKLKIKDNSKLNEKLPFRRSFQRFFAFPFLRDDKEKVVNLRDIEQGLDQINRLSSQSAKMTMDSGTKPGHSNVIITNKIDHLTTLSFGVDNSGNQSTGRQKRKLTLNQDNLFGINDNIYLNYSQSNGQPLFGTSWNVNNILGTTDNSNTRYSKSFYGQMSVPLGYLTVGGSYSFSKYLLTTTGTATTFKSSGNSESKSIYADYVLSRGQKYKISLKAELDRSDTDSYLEDTYIPINSRRLTEANLYLNNTFYLPIGSIYIQPKYSKGLDALNSLDDENDLARDKPRAQ